MENIYRGYPQALCAMERRGDLMPYMLYRREEQERRKSPEKRRRYARDLEYFKGLYPQSARRYSRFVEAGCDRYDNPSGPVYDEYPDREALFAIQNRILSDAREQGEELDRDLVWLLMLYEILRRREERD